MSTADVASIATLSTDPASREASPGPSFHRRDVTPSTGPVTDEEVSPAPPSRPHVQETPQSQPMTATGSNSSLNPSPETTEAADENTAGPYGTRSRNRTAGSRPNYAEDKELDLEIEAAGRYPRVSAKKSSAATTAPSNVESSTATNVASTGTGFAAINSAATAQNEHSTASAPATSHAASTAPAVSKKRKQPGSNVTIATSNINGGPTYHAKPSTANNARSYIETNMMSFDRCKGRLNAKDQLVADDGTTLATNDHVYFVCEPPGEPYYLARIMEFLHAKNDPLAPIDSLRVNWYYRPKDILRRVQDTRVVFASMHSDTCPLTSIRGKCTIQHLSEIASLDDYRIQKDCFWFDKLYDRYMHRYYEVIPTGKVVNVPQHVKKVLDERWKYVLVEIGRGRELTTESKKCRKCEQFAANNDSVDCAVCKNTYHMLCVRPPLQKKPARGFAWACAACSRAQELRLEARHTPAMSESAQAAEDDLMEEDEDDGLPAEHQETRESSLVPDSHAPPTAAQIAQANLWPYRYLGIHSRVEDALDYDDRIYPRASSRLGPRHQANVNVWHGRPVQLVKPAEIKKKYLKTAGATSKKDAKSSKDTSTVVEADKDHRLKRPKWVVDEPVGYVARGQDDPLELKGKKEYTARLTFKMPDPSQFTDRGMEEDDDKVISSAPESLVDQYMKDVKAIAPQYGVLECSTDFLTKAVEKLQDNDYDPEKALEAMKNLSIRNDLKQPDLNREELKRFEEGVAKYGSELHAVARHVGSNVKEARIVRHYYMWKKTDKGRQIWGSYEGRRSKKEPKRVDKDGSGVKLLDDVADDQDDSAFDTDKATQQKRGFECKFCATRSSRQWRRAPGTAPGTLAPREPGSKNAKDKSTWLTLALCGRCAYLWRRYAIQYESMEEVSKKIAASAGRATKRKIDEELMRTIFEAQHESGDLISTQLAQEVNKSGMEVPQSIVQPEEPIKKKIKAEKDPGTATPEVVPEKKKVVPEKPVELPLEPEPPRVKVHPCAVCQAIDLSGQELLKCRDCRLHVHGSCYGVGRQTNTKPWFCDMCRNDHNLQVSTIYDCVLCPVRYTAQELMEPLRVSHKKKSDREREKERLEREMIQEAGRRWRHEQEAAGRPVNPREALKRTAGNNWIHITCALWTKEIKFGHADLLDDAEGVGFIPLDRYEVPCTLCNTTGLPTVKCHLSSCNSQFHVGCAHQAGYIFGFDVSLVKGSRRDSVNVMKLDQETGVVTAAIWCSSHTPPTYVHNMLELTEGGLTAMQLFAQTYKQADQSVTGTVRRAAQFTTNIPSPPTPVQLPLGRKSTVNGISAAHASQGDKLISRSRQSSPVASPTQLEDDDRPDADLVEVRSKKVAHDNDAGTNKKCWTCEIGFSPKWWTIQRSLAPKLLSYSSTNGSGQEMPGDRRSMHIAQPPAVSPRLQSRPGSSDHPKDVVMTNGVIKREPSDSSEMSVIQDQSRTAMFQCHKCHVEERVPPSSPSQMKPRRKSRVDPVQEPISYPPQYGPAPAYSVPPPPPPRPQLDGPVHSHPMSAPRNPMQVPWPGGPPQWSSPVMRNGHQPPPPLPPPPPPPPGGNLYAPNYGPPPPMPDYGRSYSNHRPPHPPTYSPMPSPSNGIPQHSPPPPSRYSLQPPPLPPPHPPSIPQQQSVPLSSRPISPPRYGPDRHVSSPRGLGQHNMLSRPYPPDHQRPGSMDASVNGYAVQPPPPPPPPPRMYSQQPPPMRPGSSQAQSLAQIAQAATGHVTLSHSRQPSAEGTPRLGPAPGSGRFPESPTQRPMTPADGPRDEGRMGPGASASPRIHNLLT